MVFQNPFDTLNPSMTVGRQIIRALEIFKRARTTPSGATGCWNCSIW
jgi:ABC-type dipeptide/oligopeptide/nickel transport system ATPase component